jgi:hypothetical protein
LTFIECNVSCKPINETKIIFARDLQVIKLWFVCVRPPEQNLFIDLQTEVIKCPNVSSV